MGKTKRAVDSANRPRQPYKRQRLQLLNINDDYILGYEDYYFSHRYR